MAGLAEAFSGSEALGNLMMLGVIQVRMGSTRLPGKALKTVLGKPLLLLLYERMLAAKTLDRVVIATADNEANKPIVRFAQENGIGCFAGSEQDLVDRFYRTARHFKADAIVRVTADCPLVDPELIDQMTDAYLTAPSRQDYMTNALKPSYPDGLDLDLLPTDTLERLQIELKDPFWREWFTSYLREHPKEFRTVNLETTRDLSAMRWTVDHPEDLAFVEAVFARLYPLKKIFVMRDILELLKREPALAEINQKYTRDAAYAAAKKESGK